VPSVGGGVGDCNGKRNSMVAILEFLRDRDFLRANMAVQEGRRRSAGDCARVCLKAVTTWRRRQLLERWELATCGFMWVERQTRCRASYFLARVCGVCQSQCPNGSISGDRKAEAARLVATFRATPRRLKRGTSAKKVKQAKDYQIKRTAAGRKEKPKSKLEAAWGGQQSMSLEEMLADLPRVVTAAASQ